MNKKNLHIQFAPEINGLVANTIGDLSKFDIFDWSERLLNLIEKHFYNKDFQLLINGNGYHPQSLDTHRTMNHFLHSNEILKKYCKAVAFVHHDRNHVKESQPLASETQNFFSFFGEAYDWLKLNANLR